MASSSLKFYNAWFCPFAQRVWIALLHKGVPFEYIEQDPYNKSAEWLAINPRGLVPVLIHNGQNVYESAICIEYLEDSWPQTAPHLLPPNDAYQRARARLLSDHISKKIIPHFYACLQKQSIAERTQAADAIYQGILTLMNDASDQGPFLLGADFSMPDIMLAPWAQRFDIVLRHYRGVVIPCEDGIPPQDETQRKHADAFKRYHAWYKAVQALPCYKQTLAEPDQLIARHQRLADNTSKSEVANAIRSGTALP